MKREAHQGRCQLGFSRSFPRWMKAAGFDIIHSPHTRNHIHTSMLLSLILNLQD